MVAELSRLDEDGAGRFADTLYLFNDRDGRFSRKKERPSRSLASLYRSNMIQVCPRVFQWPREGTETSWHSLTLDGPP